MPVGELLSRMSSRELTEWQAFARLEAEDRMGDDSARRAEKGLAQVKGRHRMKRRK